MATDEALRSSTEEIVQQLEFLNKNLDTIATNLAMIYFKLDSIEKVENDFFTARNQKDVE